jgi:outer membrane protein, heavy metal efflux system
VLQSYKQRQISLLEFIDFFDAYKETNSRLLQQQFNLQRAKEELNFQTGTDVIK